MSYHTDKSHKMKAKKNRNYKLANKSLLMIIGRMLSVLGMDRSRCKWDSVTVPKYFRRESNRS